LGDEKGKFEADQATRNGIHFEGSYDYDKEHQRMNLSDKDYHKDKVR